MPFIGTQPAETALTTGNLGDDIVTEAKMANDAIGLAELKAGTDGELITWDASGNPAAVAAGTSGHFLKSQGAGSVPVFAAAGGKVISRYYDEDADDDTTTTQIPSDDTAPTSSEGAATDLSITTGTLASSSNRLRVRVIGVLSNSATQDMALTLFNGGAAAIRTVWATARAADWPEPLVLEYEYAPGATTAVTFTVRYGSNSGTCAKNGTTSTRRYEGTAALTMVVEEIEP